MPWVVQDLFCLRQDCHRVVGVYMAHFETYSFNIQTNLRALLEFVVDMVIIMH